MPKCKPKPNRRTKVGETKLKRMQSKLKGSLVEADIEINSGLISKSRRKLFITTTSKLLPDVTTSAGRS